MFFSSFLGGRGNGGLNFLDLLVHPFKIEIPIKIIQSNFFLKWHATFYFRNLRAKRVYYMIYIDRVEKKFRYFAHKPFEPTYLVAAFRVFIDGKVFLQHPNIYIASILSS